MLANVHLGRTGTWTYGTRWIIYWLCGLVPEKWAAVRSVVSGSYAAGNFAWVISARDSGGFFGTTVRAWLGERLSP